jgi:hypothetical protein
VFVTATFVFMAVTKTRVLPFIVTHNKNSEYFKLSGNSHVLLKAVLNAVLTNTFILLIMSESNSFSTASSIGNAIEDMEWNWVIQPQEIKVG